MPTTIMHIIVVNEEINKHGIRVHIPYCHCGWKGGEYATQQYGFRAGTEKHIDLIIRGKFKSVGKGVS